MRLDVLSSTALLPSSSQAPGRALHGRPTKESPTARRHRASESTSQQSVLPTHHSQPWPLAHPVFQGMTRKWKRKLWEVAGMVFKPSLRREFPPFPKAFHFHWVSSWPCSQVSVSAEPAGLRLPKTMSKHRRPSTNATCHKRQAAWKLCAAPSISEWLVQHVLPRHGVSPSVETS